MNYPIAIVFGMICLAFVAHMTGGIRESLTVRPTARTSTISNDEKVERNWVQLMCAFQLVSVDLLAVAGILYLLAFTDSLQPAPIFASAIATLFALWGITWLVQLFSLRRSKKDYLLLGHWAYWFLCSGLVIWGAQTL